MNKYTEYPVFIFLISAMSALVVLGNFDINEGWYSNDIYLTSLAKATYEDYFYHRLPFLLEAYSVIANLFSVDVLALRWLSFSLAVGFIFLSYYFIKKQVNKKFALLSVLLYLSIFAGLKVYVTVQTYALTALLLQLIVIVTSVNHLNEYLKLSILVFLVVIVQWMRYPIDYIPIALFVYLFVYYWQDKRKLIFSFILFSVVNMFLLYAYESENFYFSILSGMFQGNPVSLKSYILYKMNWVTYSARNYSALLILGGFLISASIARLSLMGVVRHVMHRKWLLMSVLLVTGNISMYVLAVDGHPVQMLYVIPLVIGLFAYAGEKILQEKMNLTLYALFFSIAFVSALSCDKDFKFTYENSEIHNINKIGSVVRSISSDQDILLAFNPIYGIASDRVLARGFEFDLFGIREDLDKDIVTKYGLNNKENIMALIRSRKAKVIILDKRFFSDFGMGEKLKFMRADILDIVRKNYSIFDYAGKQDINAVLGVVDIYIRKKS